MLGLMKPTTTAGELRRVITETTEHQAGQVLQVVNGDVPAALERISEPLPKDALVDTARVRTIDVELFELHTRQPRTPPPEPKPVGRGDLRQRFGWDDDQIDTAGELGLKSGMIIVDENPDAEPRLERRWRPQDVDRWEEKARSLKL